MTKKKVCRSCKYFYEGSECPLCHSKDVSSSWQGRIAVIMPEKSVIAKKVLMTQKGEYALKVR